MYWSATFTNFSLATQNNLKQNALHDLTRLTKTMRERLKWSDTRLLQSLLILLETQMCAEWSHAPIADSDNKNDTDKYCSLAEFNESVEHFAAHFRIPLEAKTFTCHPPR